jgi:D-glycero-D-manno-heptose 1,7-bisphosphate phosphatase
MSRRVVFIDKDGTLLEDVPYNVDPAKVQLTPNAIEGLRVMRNAGFDLVLISNQSGLARGLFGLDALKRLFDYLRDGLDLAGVPFLDFYFCPHHIAGSVADYAVECDCRKPAAGMLIQAAAEHDIDLSASYVIGDILDDIEAGNRAGCGTVMLARGGETEWDLTPDRVPDYLARDLLDAAMKVTGASRLPKLSVTAPLSIGDRHAV